MICDTLLLPPSTADAALMAGSTTANQQTTPTGRSADEVQTAQTLSLWYVFFFIFSFLLMTTF
jgi:hypothetical protein